MKCPKCGFIESRVVDSRPTNSSTSIRRRRECERCLYKFTTYEGIPSNIVANKQAMMKRDECYYVVLYCNNSKNFIPMTSFVHPTLIQTYMPIISWQKVKASEL